LTTESKVLSSFELECLKIIYENVYVDCGLCPLTVRYLGFLLSLIFWLKVSKNLNMR